VRVESNKPAFFQTTCSPVDDLDDAAWTCCCTNLMLPKTCAAVVPCPSHAASACNVQLRLSLRGMLHSTKEVSCLHVQGCICLLPQPYSTSQLP
jgi:hypothetical protein